MGASSLPQDPSLNLPNKKLASWRVEAGRRVYWQQMLPHSPYLLLHLNSQFIHSSSFTSTKNYKGQKLIVLLPLIPLHFLFHLNSHCCAFTGTRKQSKAQTSSGFPLPSVSFDNKSGCNYSLLDMGSVSSLAGCRGHQAIYNHFP